MKYPFTVYQIKVDKNVFWAAESTALNGCVAQGETVEQAIAQLAENEEAWLEAAEEFHMTIPDPVPSEPEFYSGKFTVRVAPAIHEQAAHMAKKQKISLNQYVNDAIVERNSISRVFSSIQAELNEIKNMLTPQQERQAEIWQSQFRYSVSGYSRVTHPQKSNILPINRGGNQAWRK